MSIINDVKHAIRNRYAWPGGYPLYLVMADGEALSIDTARQEWRLICRALLTGDNTGGWLPMGVDVNWEDESLYCAHTGNKIESAYGES